MDGLDLHFGYLHFVGFVLASAVMPGSGAGGGRVRRRIARSLAVQIHADARRGRQRRCPAAVGAVIVGHVTGVRVVVVSVSVGHAGAAVQYRAVSVSRLVGQQTVAAAVAQLRVVEILDHSTRQNEDSAVWVSSGHSAKSKGQKAETL